MASWNSVLFVAAVGFLVTGCADNQANASHQSHYAARRQVTGSNVPQAPAYGDGTTGTADTQSSLNEMQQRSSIPSGGTGGALGGGGGGGR